MSSKQNSPHGDTRKNPVKNQRRLDVSSNAFMRFLTVINNFFPEFFALIRNIPDPRRHNTIYSQELFIAMLILKDLTGINTMRGMDSNLVSDALIHNVCLMAGIDWKDVENSPSYQTINDYMKKLPPDELRKMHRYLVTALIDSKRFYDSRLNSKWMVILDGTGLYSSNRKLNDLCVTKVHTDKETGEETETYQYSVLQAVLYLDEGLLVPLGCEFIGKDYEGESKQDCENKAAKRLLNTIHNDFPRLPLCVMGDSLYATEPLMRECVSYGYDYLFRIKEGSQPLIMEDFRDLLDHDLQEGRVLNPCSMENGEARFVNNVQDITNKDEVFNLINYTYTADDGTECNFDWVTNIELTEKTLKKMVRGGRKRWKIENIAFKNMKLDFSMEHLCCYDETAMQNHYLIKWIAYVFYEVFRSFDKILHWNADIAYTAKSVLLQIYTGLAVILSPEQEEETKRRRSYYWPDPPPACT